MHIVGAPRLKDASSSLLLLPLSNRNHQVDYFVPMVHAGYVCVSVIHQTLTWNTVPLMYMCDLLHVYTHGTSTYSLIRRTFVG